MAGQSTSGRSSFVVIANRLPVDEVTLPDGTKEWQRSPGGLVSALRPVTANNNGAWIGWTGAVDDPSSVDDRREPINIDGTSLHPVPLTRNELDRYYEGFSNATLWPLYHDGVEQPVYRRSFWEAYQRVNQRFADIAAEVAAPGAVVWVHDYQLQLVPAMLRELRPDLKIGFFLHIPFPPVELFMQLPRRREILTGLLGADLVGFQRPLAAQNFLRLTRHVLGLRPRGNAVSLDDGRWARAAAFPISIDVSEMETLVASEPIRARAKQIRAELGDPKHVLLGIDRLDYTKGIERRLKAFRELLGDGRLRPPPDTVLVQVATPSRERVEHYEGLREAVEREVGRINGDFGRVGIPAVHYLRQTADREEVAALYLAADVMMVTPLRDGMNLVAKEYVAARVDGGGTLVLSEFAGAAADLHQAYLVNPHDLDGLKDALVQAVESSPVDAARRMRAMRRHLHTHDVRHWASAFLTALGATEEAAAIDGRQSTEST